MSQQLSVILDVEDLIGAQGYVLEVSSPGLDRALRKAGGFRTICAGGWRRFRRASRSADAEIF